MDAHRARLASIRARATVLDLQQVCQQDVHTPQPLSMPER
jgi:hypothetical protein